ncbi:RagB/SusD family nutrient uptake outer membrane protein [Echinicola strongylocentroti]|uniref:RagB/SusD family nutrient uptake outer membrane protein n=1 Tax=Echinicola strongylocentroti TaxID=1795355 RepID=A0A2Z4IQ82_9BACT|nr:RagB/SusD family nutrient uptake outer membrane protein [Echinicola strongylocentroti]AWW32788.1 RagB/SusD family nutrient uptake outer membrane protein [Echinicola strongylocentroti]
MKNILIYTIILIACLGCNDDYLDVTPQDRVSEDAVWSDPNLIAAYHNGLYNGIPHGFGRHMISKYSDEAFSNFWDIQRNTLNPDNVTSVGGGNTNYLYFWGRAYQYIRKVNVFLEEMEDPQVELPDLDRMVGEAKFIRAYMYFEMVRRFGGIPLVTEVYALGDEVMFTRNTFDECVDFIDAELDEAIALLPQSYASTDADFGRATQDACQALKSRMWLYAASPLFNSSNDMAVWQKTADAAELLLDRGYSLHPDYRQMFIQESGAANEELLFVRNFSVSNSHQAPIINMNRRYGGYGGWSASNGPTQNLVDDYDMENGQPPFIYDNGQKQLNPAAGYDPQDPYADRDPRMDYTLLHNGSEYRGDVMEMWVSSDEATWGFDSFRQSGDNPRSNYVLKKFMPDEDIPLDWSTPFHMPWIHFRLAEIYLNYAEAQFELGNESVCREYINMVRARPSVALPPIGNDVTGEELRRRLYNERRIELAFEGHRYFDQRRWKVPLEELSSPIMGMDIIKDAASGELTFTPFVLGEREPFEDHMYLLPIETNEIQRNPELEQTPGW